MSEESLPQFTKAPIPVQTHILRLEERLAKGQGTAGDCLSQSPDRMEAACEPALTRWRC